MRPSALIAVALKNEFIIEEEKFSRARCKTPRRNPIVHHSAGANRDSAATHRTRFCVFSTSPTPRVVRVSDAPATPIPAGGTGSLGGRRAPRTNDVAKDQRFIASRHWLSHAGGCYVATNFRRGRWWHSVAGCVPTG